MDDEEPEGPMHEPQVDVAVVGGGLAGLAAAATAARTGARVVLLDGHPVGGRARTDDRNGFRFNRGPRALYIAGPGAKFLKTMGIRPTGGKPPLHNTMGTLGGELGLLPAGPGSLARTPLLRARSKVAVGRYLALLPRLKPERYAGTSVDGWLAGTGLADDAVALVHMLIRIATYTNNPAQLSADVAISQVQMALGKGVLYLDGGFQQLVDRLAELATGAGAELRTGQEVRAIVGELGRFELDLGDAPALHAASVVVAAGSPQAAGALTHPDGGVPASWERLGPPATAACLELGLSRPARVTTAFGVDRPLYLNHHAPPAGGLAPEGAALVHVMRYQEPDHGAGADADRAELWDHARAVGITDDLVQEQRFLSRMVVVGGYPTADQGGLPSRPPVAVEGRPGLTVAGDWVGRVGFLADAALCSGAEAGRTGAATSRPEQARVPA
jgi:phytoene dehydrogenase-like protein